MLAQLRVFLSSAQAFMMQGNWKDRSEIIRNLVSAAAVVVSGAWVVYQWDTLFPKTRADVQAAAAGVRNDVSGAFTVEIGLGDTGEPPNFDAPATADGPADLQGHCSTHEDDVLLEHAQLFGELKLRSASAIPVRARVEQVRVMTAPIIPPVIRLGTAGGGGSARPIAVTPVATIADEGLFFGGLRENRVEKGQEIVVAMMFGVEIPAKCSSLDRLLIVQSDVALTAIDPTTDRPVGTPVRKIFVTTCQLSPRASARCNIEGVQAVGQ